MLLKSEMNQNKAEKQEQNLDFEEFDMDTTRSGQTFRIERKKDIIIIHIANRFDSLNCYNIEEVINNEIKKGQKKFLFSLKHVDYISSSGYRLLVSALNDIKKVNGMLILSSLPEEIKKVFHDIKLDLIFEIYETDKEGLQNLI
ncbi:MAG: STAS domain-containing protein [Spirochaetes bacterium]|nr:STAS domain-containing protein [Spirochaetota bacterium]